MTPPQEFLDHLVAVRPSLSGQVISGSDSLTGDLGFDSLDLVSLANLLRTRYPGVDLRAWLAGTFEFELDSVEALASSLRTATKGV